MSETYLTTIKPDKRLSTGQGFVDALTMRGCKLDSSVADVLRLVAFQEALVAPRPVRLHALPFDRLTDRRRSAPLHELCAGAYSQGFQDCPAWVGVQMCLQWPKGVEEQYFAFGMQPLVDSRGVPRMWYAGHNYVERETTTSEGVKQKLQIYGYYLHALQANPQHLWFPGYNNWIFAAPE